MRRLKLSERHIASKAGIDRRTVMRFLETGQTRSIATEEAIFKAYRELVRERSVTKEPVAV